ncbi:uncharacterized protein TNCV_2629481 [Trichonephila clavipes]|uniref:Paired domain-containing protein n=1 Tax=Trichonephila clavipes TaxID=2585209 RepID=A0A8X6VK69_TRICX|nr:uncharacterized protein TNCV_2629481 [Trichonephila clavipes]
MAPPSPLVAMPLLVIFLSSQEFESGCCLTFGVEQRVEVQEIGRNSRFFVWCGVEVCRGVCQLRKPPDGANSTSKLRKCKRGVYKEWWQRSKIVHNSLKAFQCNNRIVMAQRKHLDDFLRGRIIGRLECGRTQLEVCEELGIAQSVIFRLWQRFQDDGNVSRCYSTGRSRVTAPNEDRYLAVTAKRNRRRTESDLSLQLPVRQFQGRPCTDA